MGWECGKRPNNNGGRKGYGAIVPITKVGTVWLTERKNQKKEKERLGVGSEIDLGGIGEWGRELRKHHTKCSKEAMGGARGKGNDWDAGRKIVWRGEIRVTRGGKKKSWPVEIWAGRVWGSFRERRTREKPAEDNQ